jgi:signal transduction histidine kinase
LQAENAKLQHYLNAQKIVIASLERRVGRSLQSMDVQVCQLTNALHNSEAWHSNLAAMQTEVDCLSDLVSDTLLLQKLEAGKVEVHLERLELQPLLWGVTRHLRVPKDGSIARLICKIDSGLPPAIADRDLTEAVLMDLLGRSLKYSDPGSPVLLEAEARCDRVYLGVTAQRFAPIGNRDFATEIMLCCRRIEVQQGEIACQHRLDGLQTVAIALTLG